MGRRALAVMAWLTLAACTAEPQPPKPTRQGSEAPFRNVVIIVIDTLRADILKQAHTPRLDALASTGQQVERAWSSGTWTAPSVISLFTGTPVRSHGWDLPAGHIGKYPPLPDRPTIAEVLAAHGYHTTALVTNPYLTTDLGFDRGFARYRRTSDEAMLKALKAELTSERDVERPQFFYLHLLGPHSPLRPSAAARERLGLDEGWFKGPRGLLIGAAKRNQASGVRAAYAAAYRGVVEDTDERVGALVDTLTSALDDTLFVVTSDHGELLGEHGIVGHGPHLWEPLTAVPLIVGGVANLPRQMSIDAIPDLITDLLSIEATWPSQVGASDQLVSQREGATTISDTSLVKWIWNSDGGYRFDLQTDPDEQHPSSIGGAGETALRAWHKVTPKAEDLPLIVSLPEATQRELKALGYTD